MRIRYPEHGAQRVIRRFCIWKTLNLWLISPLNVPYKTNYIETRILEWAQIREQWHSFKRRWIDLGFQE